MRSRKQRISFKIILKVRVQKEDEKDRGRLKPKRSGAAITCPTEKLWCKADISTPLASKFKTAKLPVPGFHRIWWLRLSTQDGSVISRRSLFSMYDFHRTFRTTS